MAQPIRTIRAIDGKKLLGVAIAGLGDRCTATAASMLLSEIARAKVLKARSVPAGIVAMHRDTEIHDNVTNTPRRVRLVYPGDEAGPETVSVLTSLGATLLGLCEGDSVEWCTPARDRCSITVLRARAGEAKRKESSVSTLDAKNESGMRAADRIRGHQPVSGGGQDADLGRYPTAG
jgi:regulator of nucleoside diphosphate kinase